MIDTTRRYPRSMAQAWPRDHANAIEYFSADSAGDKAVRWCSYLAAFVIVFLLTLEAL